MPGEHIVLVASARLRPSVSVMISTCLGSASHSKNGQQCVISFCTPSSAQSSVDGRRHAIWSTGLDEPSVPKETGAQHLSSFRPIAWLTTVRKLVEYLLLMTLGTIQCESFQRAFVKKKQPPATRNMQHLDGSRKSKRVAHPTFRGTHRLGKNVRPLR